MSPLLIIQFSSWAPRHEIKLSHPQIKASFILFCKINDIKLNYNQYCYIIIRLGLIRNQPKNPSNQLSQIVYVLW